VGSALMIHPGHKLMPAGCAYITSSRFTVFSGMSFSCFNLLLACTKPGLALKVLCLLVLSHTGTSETVGRFGRTTPKLHSRLVSTYKPPVHLDR